MFDSKNYSLNDIIFVRIDQILNLNFLIQKINWLLKLTIFKRFLWVCSKNDLLYCLKSKLGYLDFQSF